MASVNLRVSGLNLGYSERLTITLIQKALEAFSYPAMLEVKYHSPLFTPNRHSGGTEHPVYRNFKQSGLNPREGYVWGTAVWRSHLASAYSL